MGGVGLKIIGYVQATLLNLSLINSSPRLSHGCETTWLLPCYNLGNRLTGDGLSS